MEAQGHLGMEDIVKPCRNTRIALGVSAGHIDWTMVPYVRKSFLKHFTDGLDYLEYPDDIDEATEVRKQFADTFSITDVRYKAFEKAYGYALDMTERELRQAVEGMYHNLK